MKRNVAVISGICLAVCLAAFSCASAPPVEGLVGLDEAMEQAAAAIEAKAAAGSGIVVAVITSPSTQTGNFLAEELTTRISMRGNLIALARGTALAPVDKEQQFQMSGQVSDASAVGIGHFLGAKTVITGTFDRYAGFSQLRLRAVDVETSALTASFTARIRNNDPVLANLGGSLQGTEDASVGDQALAHLNRGKDQLAVKAWDAAIG
ncbi:MAG: hypothetical protein LBP23_07715, partial [Treponema sp.]|nr:hypothetical protein [Treponema sp.]